MNKITSKSGIGRICLMLFILLCSVFTSENAFSHKYWHKENVKVSYDKSDNSITFYFLIYDYHCALFHEPGNLEVCKFWYNDGWSDIYLMKSLTHEQDDNGRTKVRLADRHVDHQLKILNSVKPSFGTDWTTDHLDVQVNIMKRRYPQGKDKKSYIGVKWKLPNYSIQIRSIRVSGLWNIPNVDKEETFDDSYYPTIIGL